MPKISIACDVCSVRKPGFLWLGGNDWVECPQCVNGWVEAVEQAIKPRGKAFIAGDTRGFTLHHPEHERRFG
jgi:hypothetical protein